ncbi:PulJ/GspJ family protein [Desulfofustis glycolicus]|uniref:Prepilin-type N-terminal cleavage/methylation domain-containing protein n=1 Tax=Desulfofustis glycolicus DSM 9705 TaxID=1121409 RepID=A0A1M5XFM7_9BACT|nr:prepilin-type N-terminal cleavage/methylation domain-containing protein [Desulfofustis glycolicus]SHH98314.1 prepilin-type N-terminal cleavage/methylation domain-containing protein [Desulfofustis glycolicus DSM 9705]
MRSGAIGRPTGFTLLEVLIAISLFAIAVSIVYALYGAMISVVDRVEEKMAHNDRIQVALERINHDLAGLYRGERGYLIGRSIDYRGDEPFLEFLSTTRLVFDPSQPPLPLTLIRFYLQDDDEDTAVLLRSESPILPGQDEYDDVEGVKTVLCRGLGDVEVSYFRGMEERDEWDSSSGTAEQQEKDERFPEMVKLELVFADPAGEGVEGERYPAAVYLRPAQLTFEGT